MRGHRVPGPVRLAPRDAVLRRAVEAPYAALVRNNCGQATLATSWWIAVCPIDPRRSRPYSLDEAPALTSHRFFIRRHGLWLNWFLA